MAAVAPASSDGRPREHHHDLLRPPLLLTLRFPFASPLRTPPPAARKFVARAGGARLPTMADRATRSRPSRHTRRGRERDEHECAEVWLSVQSPTVEWQAYDVVWFLTVSQVDT